MIWYTYRPHMFIIWKAIHIRIKCGEIAYGLYWFSWRVKWGKLGELVDGIHESLCNKQIENYNTLYDFSVNDLCFYHCWFVQFIVFSKVFKQRYSYRLHIVVAFQKHNNTIVFIISSIIENLQRHLLLCNAWW